MEDVPIMHMDSSKYESEMRLGFIRKVLGIVCAQILVTFFITLAIYNSQDFQLFLAENIWILYTCLAIYVVCIIVLICSKKAARKVPYNYILLGVLTLCLSLIVAAITSQYEPFSVLMILVLTIAITLSLVVYALLAKTDFTTCWALSLVFCVCSVVILIMILSLPNGYDLRYFYYWLCLLAYGFYLVVDVQLIAGKGRHHIKHDDYIVGAMMIYVDLIQIFLTLLELFGSKK